MDESHKHKSALRKPDIKDYILYDSIYIKLKNKTGVLVSYHLVVGASTKAV